MPETMKRSRTNLESDENNIMSSSSVANINVKRQYNETNPLNLSNETAGNSSLMSLMNRSSTGPDPGEQKLDHPLRITKSLNLLNCNVREEQAAVYWICQAKTLKRVAHCISLICDECAFRVHVKTLQCDIPFSSFQPSNPQFSLAVSKDNKRIYITDPSTKKIKSEQNQSINNPENDQDNEESEIKPLLPLGSRLLGVKVNGNDYNLKLDELIKISNNRAIQISEVHNLINKVRKEIERDNDGNDILESISLNYEGPGILYICGTDKARCCVAECKIEAGAFTKFRTTLDKFNLGISLQNFLRVLSPLKDEDMVVFCLENETDDTIKIQGFYTYQRSNEFYYVKVRVEDYNMASIGLGIAIESNEYYKMEMSSTQFSELFKNYKDIIAHGGSGSGPGRKKEVTVASSTSAGANKYVNCAYTTEGQFVISIPDEAGVGVSGSTVLTESETVSMLCKPMYSNWESSINSDFIAKFGSIGSQISQKVRLYMRDGYPFACQYKDESENLKLTFYLIPRVQS